MIFYGFKCGLTQQQCIDRLCMAFGDEIPSSATIYNWFAEFKGGRVNVSDEFRESHPGGALVPENIDAVRTIIEAVRHLTYQQK